MSQSNTITETINRVGDFISSVAKIAAALGLVFTTIGGGIWVLVLEPKITPYLELPQVVNELAEAIDSQGREISRLREGLASLVPQRPVVEYDTTRVGYPVNCYVGETCTMELTARRTPFGDTCTITQVQRFVRNHYGVTRPVDLTNQPFQLDTDWLTIPITFMLPEAVKTGLGEFFTRSTYEECEGLLSGQTINETSPSINFNILRKTDTPELADPVPIH